MKPRGMGLLLAAVCLLFFSSVGTARGASAHATVKTVLDRTAYHPGDHGLLAIVVDVESGYHAQSHTPSSEDAIAFSVQFDADPHIDLGTVVYPAGKNVEYPVLGKLNVYTGSTTVFVPFTVHSDTGAGALKLSGKCVFQICDDKTCYAPQRPKLEIATQIVAMDQNTAANEPKLFAAYVPPTTQATPATRPATAPARIEGSANMSDVHSFGWAIGVALLAGLLFNVMPCVLPVLPLKAIGFYEVSQHERGKCLALGLVFSVGLVAVFALLATLVLVLKVIQWGELFSKPWFIWSIVGILVIMALGLFGVFTTSLPTGIYRFTPRHDTYTGNFGMGALTAVLATPCTAPLLPPLLLWAVTQPAVVGVVAVTMVGVGMALPYLLLSAFPQLAQRMPRTGPWPELFKQMMGFLLLVAAAVFGAGQLIDGPAFWWPAVVVVFIACAFMLYRATQLATSKTPIVVCSILALLFCGGSIAWAGQVNGLFEKQSRLSQSDEAKRWQPYTPAAFDAARKDGKIVLVKFTANWCLTCQYIEGTVFRDPQVWDALGKAGVVMLKADLTKENPPANELLTTLNPAGGIPLTAIYPRGGDRPVMLASVYSSNELLEALKSFEK